MTRKDLDTINNDRLLIDLRMQAEELINNIDVVSDEFFKAEALRIEKKIDDRISFLIQQMKE